MIEKQIRSVLRDLVEQKAPATEINLWPAIEFQLEKSRLPTSDLTKQRGIPMNTRQPSIQWLPKAALIVLAAVLCGVFFFATPQGRALAQEVLRFFTQSASDTIPAPTQAALVWVEQTPGFPAPTPTPQPGPAFEADCGSFNNPKCSIEQIRGKVNFTVMGSGSIPEGMVFAGATGEPDKILILYDTPDHSGGLMLLEQPWTGSAEQTKWHVGASAVVETVQASGITGEYVKGSFSYKAGETQEQWDANADVQTLRWVENGIFVTMQNFGSVQLDREKFIALAGSLTAERAVAIPPIPTQEPKEDPVAVLNERFSLSVGQVEKEAGFTIHLPTRLPEVLTLLGARYESEQKRVIIFYHFVNGRDGGLTNGLSLAEQAAPGSSDCNLCGFIQGLESDKNATGKVVGKDAKIEKVQIGSMPGQYVEGVWKGTSNGWVWEPDPYLKMLRWQSNGMAFELQYMGMEITKEDMISIAASIQ